MKVDSKEEWNNTEKKMRGESCLFKPIETDLKGIIITLTIDICHVLHISANHSARFLKGLERDLT